LSIELQSMPFFVWILCC